MLFSLPRSPLRPLFFSSSPRPHPRLRCLRALSRPRPSTNTDPSIAELSSWN
ncbi:hypothetical protein E2C01_085661 [Portunus trituberculatus]|uniref:Uncharacterized protein n=1 Tax=Portunus trituberculatus TaxID=210409 RepID=A0A5B7JE94_PORTR|nr:hypothetical protein [Portunus trituberculatus]